MDDSTKALLIILGIAGVGITAAVLLSKKQTGYPPQALPGPGNPHVTLIAGPTNTEYQSYEEASVPVHGIENYSEIVWTDGLGNERRMVSRRVIH